jgi:hypothetical protein
MEVHAHTHTPRKKWTHYIWEFLMLFLAVFCGFLAEYQLEHKIEKERGKQYLQSFVEDLRTDTSSFSNLIEQYEEKTTALKSMTECFLAVQEDRSNSCMLKLFTYSVFFPDLIYTDRTLQQLKNAGGLRLIPAEAADSIIEYDKLLRLYKTQESTSYQEIQTAIRTTIYSLNIFGVSLLDKTKQVQISKDNDLLNKYFNQLFLYSQSTEGNLQDIKEMKARAKSLIHFFTTKYHLK